MFNIFFQYFKYNVCMQYHKYINKKLEHINNLLNKYF